MRMPIKYPKPTTVRLDDVELEIIERIREFYVRPGFALSTSDAMGVALHEWEAAHPVGVKDALVGE